MDRKEEKEKEKEKEKEMNVNPEVEEIHCFLEKIRVEDGVDYNVTYKDSVKGREVDAIMLMWPIGKRFLATHSDSIYCDSLWNVSVNGFACMTIVIDDDNDRLRLTCVCLAKSEEKEAWQNFFFLG